MCDTACAEGASRVRTGTTARAAAGLRSRGVPPALVDYFHKL